MWGGSENRWGRNTGGGLLVWCGMRMRRNGRNGWAVAKVDGDVMAENTGSSRSVDYEDGYAEGKMDALVESFGSAWDAGWRAAVSKMREMRRDLGRDGDGDGDDGLPLPPSDPPLGEKPEMRWMCGICGNAKFYWDVSRFGAKGAWWWCYFCETHTDPRPVD